MKFLKKKTYMSVGEVADFLGLDPALVSRMIENGELVAEKVGTGYKVEQSVGEAYKTFAEKSSFEANSDCGGCGWRYSSKESFRGRCTKCGAPLCFDCWIRLGKRICSDCEK